MGPHPLAESMTTEYRANGHRRPNPVSFVNCLPNMPAHYVSQFLGARGPLQTPIAACATGTQAIGDATELIRSGRADVVFAGGTEAILVDYVMAGFASLSALAEGYEGNPTEASRPFDAGRSGFVLSEGCGVLVVESLEHALARDATIYAEVMGHASSSDAHHIAQIDPEARGMICAMQGALDDARLPAEAIDAVNAHGTGTEPNDRLETMAIRQVFGAHADATPVTSVKSMIGHLMAAAGAVEAIAAVQSLREGVLTPTINYTTPDPACDLDYVPNEARDMREMRCVLSNNFGLGGQNACVILGKL
jgi:3-oxoacyl-(acyl-carrier-protein) synthase